PLSAVALLTFAWWSGGSRNRRHPGTGTPAPPIPPWPPPSPGPTRRIGVAAHALPHARPGTRSWRTCSLDAMLAYVYGLVRLCPGSPVGPQAGPHYHCDRRYVPVPRHIRGICHLAPTR